MKRASIVLALALVTACSKSPSAPSSPAPATGPLFTMSGRGDNVFTIPSTVRRIHITGSITTSCQNFIVEIGGRLIVNVIIGTCSVADARAFDGTYQTTGGLVEITNSTGVTWTFTEVR